MDTRNSVLGSTFFGLLAEFGEANIPMERVAPKYFGLGVPLVRRGPSLTTPGGKRTPALSGSTTLLIL